MTNIGQAAGTQIVFHGIKMPIYSDRDRVSGAQNDTEGNVSY